MIPSYLKKFHHEIIVMDGKPKLVEINLVDYSIQKWPKNVLMSIHSELIKDHKALKALNDMKIPEKDQIEKFTACRFGGFDDEADISANGKLTADYLDCPKRGNCIGEGIVCKNIKCENGILSRRELEYCRLVACDLPDKQIADKMNISIHTVNTYRKNAEKKIGVDSKTGIAAFIVKKNLI